MFSAQKNASPSGRLYVEDVFSTWLYRGNGSTLAIANGIDLAGKGGLVWGKVRETTYNHFLVDTVRGANQTLFSNTSDANQNYSGSGTVNNFTSTGFSVGTNALSNQSNVIYASWTFREAPKFFDVVTYTGTGANRTIAHNLGVAPGCMIVKRTDTTSDWQVYHRGIANTEYVVLNSDAAKATGTTRWNSTTPTSTEFTVGTDATVNASGGTYVAYLFAHDATSDGIIQCGAAAAQTNINLGWEPQFVIIKKHDAIQTWFMNDNMRGMAVTGATARDLYPNTADAESGGSNNIFINSTGFNINLTGNYIYIAIRRGPMKTPTLGTSVFAPVAWTGNGTSPRTITGGGFPVDLSISYNRNAAGWDHGFVDRLRGTPTNNSTAYFLSANATTQEITNQWGNVRALDIQDGVSLYTGSSGFQNTNDSGSTYVGHLFRRAPGFFDEVCYTGTGSATTFNHNLGVVPELIIVKSRSVAVNWTVYSSTLGNSYPLFLNATSSGTTNYGATMWGSTAPTATQFPVGTYTGTNNSGSNYVAYLFASCPGVSKVGSYTGNGSSQTINCGFAAGARFVMIKRTDSTGDWYVWDTARGIVAGNDPHLSLNTTAAEVTTDDTIDTDSTGFVVNQVSATNVNVSSATYIYLAIA